MSRKKYESYSYDVNGEMTMLHERQFRTSRTYCLIVRLTGTGYVHVA